MTNEELNKACEWLENQYDYADEEYLDDKIQEFRKAMEGISGNKEEIPSKYDADYLQSKIDAFTEARKKDGKTADEVLEECRGGAFELTWQDIAEIIVAYGYVPKLNKDGSIRPAEDVFKDTLKRFKEEGK